MYCMIKYFDTPLVPPTTPHTVISEIWKLGLELMEMAQKEILVEHQKYVMHLKYFNPVFCVSICVLKICSDK